MTALHSRLNADRSSNPLAPEHYATEKLIAATGIPATILRNAWYHEIYTRLLPQYLASGEVASATGGGRISGAARADFAAAAAAVLLADSPPTGVLELGGQSITLAELAATISEVSGQQLPYREIPADEYAVTLRARGEDPGYLDYFVATDSSIAKGEMETDSTALAELVGRDLIPLAETMRKAL